MNNEHLTEALRRLRKSTSDVNVDRRLVTNVLLSFLTTSRADSKRFEMLQLLSTILGWDDAEREKAGLQRQAKRPQQRRKSSSKETSQADEEMNEVSVRGARRADRRAADRGRGRSGVAPMLRRGATVRCTARPPSACLDSLGV